MYFLLCGRPVSHAVLTFAGGIRCANAKPLLMSTYVCVCVCLCVALRICTSITSVCWCSCMCVCLCVCEGAGVKLLLIGQPLKHAEPRAKSGSNWNDCYAGLLHAVFTAPFTHVPQHRLLYGGTACVNKTVLISATRKDHQRLQFGLARHFALG